MVRPRRPSDAVLAWALVVLIFGGLLAASAATSLADDPTPWTPVCRTVMPEDLDR
jgi:hypothetical protein